ncbi:glycosyltransferase family 2 protein [Flavobacterium marginilacus]|uniref:glycosyltransferase family 2 protein n=1 Tax=Flavobacterium marginilacus TaxID=3003256 RepID=UPI00248E3E01|nr:glycosyltransferase family 2 protein [Flavobacterium marginilacus]
MIQPKLSIITINYNNAKGLDATIKSVITQTYLDFEFLIVDGDSTDRSKDVINQYSTSINYHISEPDTGIYNAMNKGIKASKGEYLLFLNSGDVLNGMTAVNDFVNNIDFAGDIIYGDYKFQTGGKIFPDNLSPLFFVRTSLPHQSTLFKREVFDKMGLYDERYKVVADRAFYIKCFLSNQFIFKHINYPLTVFDLSGVSNDPRHNEKHLLESESMFREYYGLYFDDYKNMLRMHSELNQAKRETLLGIFNRIIQRIRKVCGIR